MSVNLGPYTFQLTASQGGWHMDSVPPAWRNVFQLTASQGGWRRFRFWNDWQWNFNSQPHKEADIMPLWPSAQTTVFQLTASQGGWRSNLPHQQYHIHISTHSLTRRLTETRVEWVAGDVFQLTASQGGWRSIDHPLSALSFYFNSQPHKEADRVLMSVLVSQGYFNSQPHKEADVWDAGVPMQLPISTHSLTRRLTIRSAV